MFAHIASDTHCGAFPPQRSSSSLWTPAGWSPIQFTSESTLSWSKCPQEIPQPHHHQQTQAPTLVSNTPTDGGSPCPPPKELREHPTYLLLIKWGIARGEGEGRSGSHMQELLSPWTWQGCTLPMWAPQPKSSLDPLFWGRSTRQA